MLSSSSFGIFSISSAAKKLGERTAPVIRAPLPYGDLNNALTKELSKLFFAKLINFCLLPIKGSAFL